MFLFIMAGTIINPGHGQRSRVRSSALPCKEFLYVCVLALMMVPGILTPVAQYSLILKYGLYNSWGALIFPWVSGGRVFGIVLCGNYMDACPANCSGRRGWTAAAN